MAVKTKSAKKPAAKPAKKAAKPVAKPTAKAKPAARAKPAAKPAPRAKAAPAKAKPAVSKAKPAAKAKPAPAKSAAKPVSTVKRIASAIAKIVKPAPAAKSAPKPAPKPVAAKPLPERKDAKKTAGNAPMPNQTHRPVAAAAPAKAAPPPVRDGGVRAKAVKPNRPLTPNEPPVQPLPERVDLPAGYRPGPGEEYMSSYHLEYFRQKLLNWRNELVEESKQTIDNLRDEVRDVGDDAERATRETENSLELRTRDRYRKLISKIDKALKRIEDGAYGYCEETGEEIGIERLEARPIATLCLDAQERWEHRQKLMGD